MKSAQDYLSDRATGEQRGGFNSRIQGYTQLQTLEGYPAGNRWGERYTGWDVANKMIMEGKIFYIHNFHQSHQDCKGVAFHYGGFWVCNTCGGKGFDKDWWAIKVYMDGNAWCCVGEGFVNLQESDCYAFGDTREEAIKNYGDLMTTTPDIPGFEGTREALNNLGT